MSDDLISRQAAIDFVDDVPYIKDHPNIGLLWKAWVEQLPSAQPEQRWIPCSERLPDKEGNYLMTAQPTYNHAKDIRIAHWSGRWVGYVRSEILAWMPLPEPYKGEES